MNEEVESFVDGIIDSQNSYVRRIESLLAKNLVLAAENERLRGALDKITKSHDGCESYVAEQALKEPMCPSQWRPSLPNKDKK